MSSELVKKLEDREQTLRENSLVYRLDEGYDYGFIDGFLEATNIVKAHEAEQMKGMDLRKLVDDKDNYATPEEAEKLFIQAGYTLVTKNEQMKEPFYQLDEEQEKLLEKCKKEFRCLRLIYTSDKACEDLISMYPLSLRAIHAFTTWAIEQEKKEEEEE
ncbi:hypothetical protein D3Y79_02365 [Listeria monocytogenes]|nr:hypothetical protein [Listeria monocytogenes]